MTVEKSQNHMPVTRATTNAAINSLHGAGNISVGSNSHSSFRQCLDESKKNQQADTKKTQSVDIRKQSMGRLTADDLNNSKASVLLNQYPSQSDSVNLGGLFIHTGIINAGIANSQIKLFKDLVAAKKFQKHFDNLVAHARLNCDISSIKGSSIIIFESSDCATDRYILSFDKTGYSLRVETQSTQFADDLSSKALAFEGCFFNRTACSLRINISTSEESKLA